MFKDYRSGYRFAIKGPRHRLISFLANVSYNNLSLLLRLYL